jgi:glycosyltransferase involved in cell wall biosynthesis
VRVLLVVHRFLPHLAGTEIHTYHLARELSTRHEVKVYFRDYDDTTPGFRATDEVVEGLCARRVSLNLTGIQRNRYRMFVSSYVNPEIEHDLAQTLDQFRPNVVHFQHLMYLSARLPLIVRQRGIPAVLTLHDYWFKCNNGRQVRYTGEVCDDNERFQACADCTSLGRRPQPIRSLIALFLWQRDALLRGALRAVQAILAPSEFLRQQFVTNGYVSSDRIQVIENGIDMSSVLPRRPRPVGERVRFVYIGSIAPHKGVHVLVEAFQRMATENHARLDIWGPLEPEPTYVRELQQSIVRPDICLNGTLRRQKLWQVLSESDVLVVPSLWYEANSPLVVREALAAGVPVVASQLGAVAEKIEPGVTGLVFPPGDAIALANALQYLASTPGAIEEMRSRIRPPLSVTENAHQIESVYQSVCAMAKPDEHSSDSLN